LFGKGNKNLLHHCLMGRPNSKSFSLVSVRTSDMVTAVAAGYKENWERFLA
jgi:hypothetical protein